MIDTTQVPQYIIDCSTLTHAREIRQEMREAGVRLYCYAFTFKSEILKFGEQHKWDPTTYGERIYRQAWHIPGWPTTPKSSSGSDMLDIIQNFPNINKNDICIMIWDMTNYPRASAVDPKYEVNLLERQVIKDHIDKFGYKPLGNIKDESHMDNKLIITDQHFGSLFDYDS
jgi:hypothetical protein